ncbi:MAG: tRNA (N6-isopentenyl adenosine(37)-C2)-methylthiotransferase MiaB [Thermodesulfobacteriota bacterium]
MKHGRRVYIETFGCQMNERDSALMADLCQEAGYQPTAAMGEADLVIINTCSVRRKAEEKVYSLLGRLGQSKRRRPGLKVAVSGCVAQQEGAALCERMPHVDLVLGPQGIYRLPALLRELEAGGAPRVETALAADFRIPMLLPRSAGASPGHKAFVTIMQGCNNFCAYCVVPYTRGREISRPADDILAEIEHLCRHGVREVTLLGQNVNSYGKDGRQQVDFPRLLTLVAAVPGLARLRFTTSHPKDLSDDLVALFADLAVLCPHLHLPVQSGANRILARMNRRYTREAYLERVAALRQARPDVALTTDIIVGFPGESEADFQETMRLVEEVRFHGAFSFKYSDRPPARAAAMDDKVPAATQQDRLARLQASQAAITRERHAELVGQTIPVMADGPARQAGQWTGRTPTNLVVNFLAQGITPGTVLPVRVQEACAHSLRGVVFAAGT